MDNFKNKKVLVIGMGKSGIAAAQVLKKRQAIVTACDIKNPDLMPEAIEELHKDNINVLVGSYPDLVEENYDIIVVSPGVPLTIPPIQAALNGNIPVIGEVELAYLIKKPNLQMFAITGTNGKTTTTALLQAILEKGGFNAVVGGNIGNPLTLLVDEMDDGIIAVEVSSFQLETTNAFKPYISSILNITPDHLDRHHTMEHYVNAKVKIFKNQSKQNFTILNYDDELVKKLAPETRGKVVYFSTKYHLPAGVFIKDGIITAHIDNNVISLCNTKDVCLKGKHNLENILCATTIALLAGVDKVDIISSLKSFKGVRHRLEEVLTLNNVLYINDSKATNPESAIKAIEAFARPIILIAGGKNKGASFNNFARIIKEKVKTLILLGEAKEEIKSAVMALDYMNIYEVKDMAEGVELANKLASTNDVVLLSPACASWDMFDNYEQRGDIFCNLVHSLGVDK